MGYLNPENCFSKVNYGAWVERRNFLQWDWYQTLWNHSRVISKPKQYKVRSEQSREFLTKFIIGDTKLHFTFFEASKILPVNYQKIFFRVRPRLGPSGRMPSRLNGLGV